MNRSKRPKNTNKKRKKNIACDGHARKSWLIAQLTILRYIFFYLLRFFIRCYLLLINFQFWIYFFYQNEFIADLIQTNAHNRYNWMIFISIWWLSLDYDNPLTKYSIIIVFAPKKKASCKVRKSWTLLRFTFLVLCTIMVPTLAIKA